MMTGNSTELPILEIIFVTSDREIERAELPVLTVIFDGHEYTIVNGFDEIGQALARSFQRLGSNSHRALVLAVDLRAVGTNSSFR